MSIAEDDVEQRAVDLQPAVILDEAQLPELVHEEADARAGRADHLRQRFLADLRHDGFRPPFLADIASNLAMPPQALFPRVEDLIQEAFLHPNVRRTRDVVKR